eukprot:2627222-Prymnesium_polylepis.1
MKTKEDLDDIVTVCTERGGRRPPMMLGIFVEELKDKSFTNGKEDRPMVGELYQAAFETQMGEATELNYGNLGWGNEEMVLVAKVVASSTLVQLQDLRLACNQIGDEGMNEVLLRSSCQRRAAPQLNVLFLNVNQIGDGGMKSFSTALASGAMAQLEVLTLDDN